MKKNVLLLAFSAAFTLLLLEAGIGLATRTGLFRIKVPSYSVAQARSPIFWRDVNPDFGVWRNPSVVYRHIKACFDVIYHSNTYGARDAERLVHSERPRIVVLGDSMTEGSGVSDVHRFTNLLEQETGIEHLNFAVGGNFGTTQYYLVYKTLASKFSHSAVLVGMLPTNDFWDNDYEYGQHVYPNRYRPYLVGEHPNYRLLYHQRSIEQSTFRDRGGWLGFGQRILSEFTYSYNALAYFKLLLATVRDPAIAKDHTAREREFFDANKAIDRSRPYSGYYDYRKDQLDLVKYTFEIIKQAAGRREIIIALLPTPVDFNRYDPAATPRLSAELGEFAAANGMKLIDLLPSMYRDAKDWNDYILPCDGHWNAHGHAVAAQYLSRALAPLYQSLAR